MRTAFDWLKPHPLRMADGSDYTEENFFCPRILEYRTDDFMAEFLADIAAPDRGSFQSKPVVFEKTNPVKLFQPVHGCFYLVCASLACRQPGFPDHTVDLAGGEKTYFTLRRYFRGGEYAWVSSGKSHTWQLLNGTSREVVEDEELLPLVSVPAFGGRTLWFGYLPLSGRETYAVRPQEAATDDGKELNVPKEELEARFINPLKKGLISIAKLDDPTPPHRAVALSVYMLLDLYEFFEIYLKNLTDALSSGNPSAFSGAKASQLTQLMNLLKTQKLGGNLNLADALTQVAKQRNELDALGDADLLNANLGFSTDYTLESYSPAQGDQLEAAVVAALPEATAQDLELPKFVAAKVNSDTSDAYYMVRCVYERPQCGLVPLTVSQPSPLFRVAAHFDGAAPARPVRIPLPADVSFGAMRKFRKNVTFLISDSMQRKISRITGKEKDLLKGDALNEEDDNALTFVCSFSIQIIFIVAFMLLLIFVIIFNLLFWWLPFFRICLPLPKKWFAG